MGRLDFLLGSIKIFQVLEGAILAAGIITGEQKTLKSDKRIDVLAPAPWRS